jgi:hypothetical protein
MKVTFAEECEGSMAGGAKPSKTETAAETSSSDIKVACCSVRRHIMGSKRHVGERNENKSYG